MASPDPWYRRSEFWTMIGSILQCPFLVAIPGAGPVLAGASAVLAAAAPLLYIFTRGKVKAAQSAPVAVLPVAAVVAAKGSSSGL